MKRWVGFIVSLFLFLQCPYVSVFAEDEGTEIKNNVEESTVFVQDNVDLNNEIYVDDTDSEDNSEGSVSDDTTTPENEDESSGVDSTTEVESNDSADNEVNDETDLSDNDISEDSSKQTDDSSVDGNTEFVPSNDVELTETVDDEEASNNETSGLEESVLPSEILSSIMTPSSLNQASLLNENLQEVVYVSDTGNNDSGDGSEGNPYLTLNKAVESVVDGGTIKLLSDLELNDSVRVNDKSVIIDGQGHAVKRGEVASVRDSARTFYNPALFEINNWQNGDLNHTLTFRNIIIDDQNKVAGTDYSQQSTDGTGDNLDNVQDSIIATYRTNTIVLDEGAIVQNYGGMSAVRLTAGGTLIMKSGSKIVDTQVWERGHKSESSAGTGQPGAIWMQGGNLQMEVGSFIGGQSEEIRMNGRAVYIDSGHADIAGTIQYLTGCLDMWWGESGVAIHIRNGGHAVLKSGGLIDNINGDHAGYRGAVMTNGHRTDDDDPDNRLYDFLMEEGSSISNVTNFPALFSNSGYELLNGTISNCDNDYIIGGFAQVTTIGPTGVIEDCTARKGDAKAIVYTSNASDVHMYGTLRNNTASYGFYVINQSGGGAELFVYDGSHIEGKGTGTGVYINSSKGTGHIYGGEIKGFNVGVDVRGKPNNSVSLDMTGGIVTENKTGVKCYGFSNGTNKCIITGGTITSNDHNLIFQGGNSNDGSTSRKISIGKNLNLENNFVEISGERRFISTVYLQRPFVKLYLDPEYETINLGITNESVVSAVKNWLLENPETADWTIGNEQGLFFNAGLSDYHFRATKPSGMSNSGLFIAYLPLNENGDPQEGVDPILQEVENTEIIDISLTGLSPDTSYGIVFVNNSIYTLKPDPVTTYIGGQNNSSGFPEISFIHSIDRVTSWELNGEAQSTRGEEALNEISDLFKATYTDSNGNVVENKLESGEYKIQLEFIDDKTELRINRKDVDLSRATGELIVRHTSDINGAISGSLISNVLLEVLSEDELISSAQVYLGDMDSWRAPSIYVNDDESREVSDYSGVGILDDNLLSFEDDNRQELLEEKAMKYLGLDVDPNTKVFFDFHYLDLVDENNGNAWVSSSDGSTVYLPYPDGADKDSELTLLHFNGLHREYGINGQADVEAAIESSVVESVPINKTNNWISFEIDRSGFSPFALVWTEGKYNVFVNYLDSTTGDTLANQEIVEILESDAGNGYDVTDLTHRTFDGYELDRIEGTIKADTITQDVVINVYFKKVSKDDPSNPGTWDDGGPFTTDECGSVYDRWGNLIYQGKCGVAVGYEPVDTMDK